MLRMQYGSHGQARLYYLVQKKFHKNVIKKCTNWVSLIKQLINIYVKGSFRYYHSLCCFLSVVCLDTWEFNCTGGRINGSIESEPLKKQSTYCIIKKLKDTNPVINSHQAYFFNCTGLICIFFLFSTFTS